MVWCGVVIGINFEALLWVLLCAILSQDTYQSASNVALSVTIQLQLLVCSNFRAVSDDTQRVTLSQQEMRDALYRPLAHRCPVVNRMPCMAFLVYQRMCATDERCYVSFPTVVP